MRVIGVSLILRTWCPQIGARLSSSSSDVPVIRLSRRTQIWLEKKDKGHSKPVVTPQAGKPLISTRRRELSQASRETVSKWEKPALVSGGWKHPKSRGDYFTIHRQQEQRVWPETEETFGALGLDPNVVSSVEALDFRTPTWAQKTLIPHLLRGHNVLCAAETGGGKTLAYLLPIVHKLVTDKDYDAGRPQSLILVPSRELAEQVTSVARRIGSPLGITVKFVGGGRGPRLTDKLLEEASVDIMVATPGILLKALKWNKVSLAHLRHFVLDEADTLFDPTFGGLVEDILLYTHIAANAKEVQGQEKKTQLVIIGATFPKGVEEIVGKVTDLGSIHTIRSSKLHLLLPHVQHTFKKVKGEDKVAELLPILKKHAAEKQESGILIFCNSSKTVNWLGYILDDHGIKHARFHGNMPAIVRLGIFQDFQNSRTDVLICTSIASRGLDSCKVSTVVNFDFPFTIEDYLHRAGRVGRLGSRSPGEVLSFVTHAWDVELLQEIETAVRKKSSLPTKKSGLKDPEPKEDFIKNEQPED